VKRFSLPVICFALVTMFLTYTLVNISQNHYLSKAILNTLDNELLEYPYTTLEGTKYNLSTPKHQKKLRVIAI
jgi:hypothetical protein